VQGHHLVVDSVDPEFSVEAGHLARLDALRDRPVDEVSGLRSSVQIGLKHARLRADEEAIRLAVPRQARRAATPGLHDQAEKRTAGLVSSP
jgi:hypothetical protein